MAACRNIYGGCIKYLFRNLSVIEFGQFDSEILYSDAAEYKIAYITHKIARTTHFKIKQILTGEDRPLQLNLLIEQQILMVTKRPASADRTARRQFQATGQPVIRMQATTISR